MKKIPQIIYIVLCMVICIIPFAGMSFWATETTTENKTLAAFPSLFNESGINISFFEEFEEYFEDHFAFREAFVNADAEIMSRVFAESNEDTVIKGEDGWLYYSATLDDYLGQDLMSDRSVSNAAHNLSLVQEYVEAAGAQFIVTIAPNKNSLYGDYMPYYDSYIVSEESNQERLSALLSDQEVNYVDLFALFENQDEVLYLKRDSHWNNKGALLAYNALMDAIGMEHETYETTAVLRTKTEIGDLATMLYPLTAEPEWNYYYQYDSSYSYITDTASVEDAWIVTENSELDYSLLMFRDSFGNTLLPFMADAFGEAYFSKGEPYALGRYMDNYSPDVVIIERVERNISDFAANPPIMQCPEADEDTAIRVIDAVESYSLDRESGTGSMEATCEVTASANDASYYTISGVADGSCCDEDTVFYVYIKCGGTEAVFETFSVTTSESEYGYLLYLSKDYFESLQSEGEVEISVVTNTGGDAVIYMP